MSQTLDQQRAEYAWRQVQQVAEQRIVEEYTGLAKGAPGLIMGSGLMQSLAFLQAKSDKHQHRELLAHITHWLGKTLGGTPITAQDRFPPEPAADFTNVMAALHHAPSSLYRRATEESLALLRWIRQFADARKAMEG
jgi:CRISPR-associated protein Cmr5